jgi:hypothetical protein
MGWLAGGNPTGGFGIDWHLTAGRTSGPVRHEMAILCRPQGVGGSHLRLQTRVANVRRCAPPRQVGAKVPPEFGWFQGRDEVSAPGGIGGSRPSDPVARIRLAGLEFRLARVLSRPDRRC